MINYFASDTSAVIFLKTVMHGIIKNENERYTHKLCWERVGWFNLSARQSDRVHLTNALTPEFTSRNASKGNKDTQKDIHA